MVRHDIDIEIRRGGEVKIHIKGAKGKQCLSYVEFFKSVVGQVKDQKLTHEFYEPDSRVHIDLEQHQHVKKDDS